MTVIAPSPVEIALAALIGLLIGSFLNVVIFRGPRLWGLTDGPPLGGLEAPRSYCPSCRQPIVWTGLIPVASFILQRGKCAACEAPISARYPVVELLGGAVAVAALLAFGVAPTALAAACFGWALIALAFIDAETGYLPDAITLPLGLAGLSANAFSLFVPLKDAAIGAAIAYASFRLIDLAYKKLRGREGLGGGDAKLLAAIGAWGGWASLPLVVGTAAVATLAFVAYREIRSGGERQSEAEIPFGPGLCAAGFIGFIGARLVFGGL